MRLSLYTPILAAGLLLSTQAVQAQNSNWQTDQLDERAFIVNEGQFDGRNWQSNDIEFAVDQKSHYIFFTNEGLTYRLDKFIKNPKRDKADPNSPKRIVTSEILDVKWIGANTNVKIVPEEKVAHYYSYAIKNGDEVANVNYIEGYKKITYKNLYDNIDVEYFFHPDGGVKYNVVLHPGADPAQIKMEYETMHTNYNGEKLVIDLNNGQLLATGSLGTITEHAPVTYYSHSGLEIKSTYSFNNNTLTFDLENYDNSKTVVIDPWMVAATFNTSNAVWEVENDGADNTYVIGGETPMELKKYNAAGALQWTYTTPWDTNSVWLGTLATDNAGNSYVTSGVTAEMHKVDNAGNFVWQTSPGGSLQWNSEWWSITFNCDQTKLIVGGTWVDGILSFDFYGGIFDIDVATGAVLADMRFTHVNIGFGIPPPTPIEVRSISSSKNSQYIYLTHDSVGAIDQNWGFCPDPEPVFQEDNTHHLSYKCENYLPLTQNGGGLKALVSNDNFFYTHKGDEILQWDVNNGTLLNTVSLPGGSNTVDIFGEIVVNCSGLDVDDLGNVYAGSMDRVVKFDANLNFISQAMTTNGFTVYDVSVNSNGEVVAGGAEGNNSLVSRTGRIESFNMGASGQYALVCCDPNWCPEDFCATDPATNFIANQAGGTWSGTGITDAVNGTFDPSVAGAGTWTITYTLACGSVSYDIEVLASCLDVCMESNGDLTVTGGTGPYDWDEGTLSIPCDPGLSFDCGAFTQWGAPTWTWTFFATGGTVTPPGGADTVQVTDALGETLVIYDISALPACASSCDATITPAGPFCETDAAVNLSAVDPGGTWSGTGITDAVNGTFDPSVAGPGTWTISYDITGGCTDSDTEDITVIATDDASFSYASASYCLTDPNPTPTITGLGGGTFTISGGGTINSGTGEIDLSATGTGTFTVTYTTNGTCPDSETFDVTITAGADATITPAGPFCETDASVNLNAADPGGTWSGTGITDAVNGTFDPATAGVGTWTITYTIAGSCGDTDTEDITVNATDDASFNYASASYCLTDPDPTPTITGLGGGTFTISGGGTINSGTGEIDLSASGTGTYTITYTTSGPCPNSETFDVTITTGADATITPAGPFCESDAAVNLNAVDPGGTWSGTGITDAVNGTFDPAVAGAGTWTITYTISGSCGDTDTEDITVIADDDASFNYASASYCVTDPNPTPTITGTGGGTFSIDGGGTINSGTGEIDIAATGTGTYTVTYTTSGTCPDVGTFIVTITTGADATITPAGPFCETDAAVNLSAVDAGGTWSGTGITDAVNGTFDPAVAGAGTWTITYDISGGCGDTDTEDIIVNATDDASFSYSSPTYCLTDPNPSPTITGLGGGTFTISGGGTINSGTGEIDIAATGAGTFTVTYTTNGPCPTSETFDVTLTSGADATITPAGPFCANDPAINLSAVDGGGTWSGTGITDAVNGTFDPSVAGAGTWTITYVIAGSCGDTDTETITVNALDDASFNYATTTYCITDPNPSPTVTGLGGGTFSIDGGGTINPTTGEIDIAATGSGTYNVTYTTNGTCPNTSTVTVTISTSGDATITGSGPYCLDDPSEIYTAASGGGTWSGPGINPTTGEFDPALAGPGTHQIIYTIPGSCGDADTVDITVNPLPPADAGNDTIITLGSTVTLNGSGGTSYTWTPGTDLSCTTCEDPDADPEVTTTYTVEVTDANGCTSYASVTVTVSGEGFVWVPNAFSPNADGENDWLYVRGAGLSELQFFVYDRWGEKVFETATVDQGWDGTYKGQELNTAVFVYYLKVVFVTGEEYTEKGNISLIR